MCKSTRRNQDQATNSSFDFLSPFVVDIFSEFDIVFAIGGKRTQNVNNILINEVIHLG